MTAQQQLIAGLLQANTGEARTKAAAKSATEELHAYLDRLNERRRYDRPSPFSRFVGKLANAKCAGTDAGSASPIPSQPQ